MTELLYKCYSLNMPDRNGHMFSEALQSLYDHFKDHSLKSITIEYDIDDLPQ